MSSSPFIDKIEHTEPPMYIGGCKDYFHSDKCNNSALRRGRRVLEGHTCPTCKRVLPITRHKWAGLVLTTLVDSILEQHIADTQGRT
ncbi:hypothetical protein C1H46_008049 [Malus baccata]|uniref:Uncharacterized protein n=1 Tax=Malus baccata TaxID=106549 RepID=A0A540N5L9_MALBA|nr:hypothetical protein C1H46_008049 [Malus baccata]